jgi:uncharacterized protein YjbJ (UPF0337 family)
VKDGWAGIKVMSWDRFECNWSEAKEKISGKWSKLTTGDLDFIDGHRDLLEAVIQQRYGFALDYVRKEIDDWFRWQDWRSPCLTTPLMKHRSQA